LKFSKKFEKMLVKILFSIEIQKMKVYVSLAGCLSWLAICSVYAEEAQNKTARVLKIIKNILCELEIHEKHGFQDCIGI